MGKLDGWINGIEIWRQGLTGARRAGGGKFSACAVGALYPPGSTWLHSGRKSQLQNPARMGPNGGIKAVPGKKV